MVLLMSRPKAAKATASTRARAAPKREVSSTIIGKGYKRRRGVGAG